LAAKRFHSLNVNTSHDPIYQNVNHLSVDERGKRLWRDSFNHHRLLTFSSDVVMVVLEGG